MGGREGVIEESGGKMKNEESGGKMKNEEQILL